MNTQDEVLAFQERIKNLDLRVDDVLRRAGVDRSTWTRWKAGTTVPRLDTWRAMERAVEDLLSENIEAAE